MTQAADPKSFEDVDLRDFVENGILMAANEAFFWPLGLALTFRLSEDHTRFTDLHVREWVFEDGHHESIAVDPHDELVLQRREAFENWLNERLASMPEKEAEIARQFMFFHNTLADEATGS